MNLFHRRWQQLFKLGLEAAIARQHIVLVDASLLSGQKPYKQSLEARSELALVGIFDSTAFVHW